MLALPEIITGNEQNQEGGKDKEQASGNTSWPAAAVRRATAATDRTAIVTVNTDAATSSRKPVRRANQTGMALIHQTCGERHEISFVVVDLRKKNAAGPRQRPSRR